MRGFDAGAGADRERRASKVPQLLLNASFLYSDVLRLCQAIVGTIASTRWSLAAVTNWMPPP